METSAMIHAMKDSISEVLEQMFFLPIDFIDPQQTPADDALDDGEVMGTTVGFSGSPSGSFRLSIPKTLATAVTADFMGVLPETLSEEQVTGTVKEMINMLAGNTLSAYAPQAVFDLQIPEIIAPATAKESAGADQSTIDIWIQTLESRMTLQLVTVEKKDR